MAEFFASKDWQTFLDVLPSIPAETWDTFYSTVVATLFALVIGLPLGVLLVTGEPGGVISEEHTSELRHRSQSRMPSSA